MATKFDRIHKVDALDGVTVGAGEWALVQTTRGKARIVESGKVSDIGDRDDFGIQMTDVVCEAVLAAGGRRSEYTVEGAAAAGAPTRDYFAIKGEIAGSLEDRDFGITVAIAPRWFWILGAELVEIAEAPAYAPGGNLDTYVPQVGDGKAARELSALAAAGGWTVYGRRTVLSKALRGLDLRRIDAVGTETAMHVEIGTLGSVVRVAVDQRATGVARWEQVWRVGAGDSNKLDRAKAFLTATEAPAAEAPATGHRGSEVSATEVPCPECGYLFHGYDCPRLTERAEATEAVSLTSTGRCAWPSGEHLFRGGQCTRCGRMDDRAYPTSPSMTDAARTGGRLGAIGDADGVKDAVAQYVARGWQAEAVAVMSAYTACTAAYVATVAAENGWTFHDDGTNTPDRYSSGDLDAPGTVVISVSYWIDGGLRDARLSGTGFGLPDTDSVDAVVRTLRRFGPLSPEHRPAEADAVDLYDVAAEWFAEDMTRCVVCGEYVDHCTGHGGSETDMAILDAHDAGMHFGCHPDACPGAADVTEYRRGLVKFYRVTVSTDGAEASTVVLAPAVGEAVTVAMAGAEFDSLRDAGALVIMTEIVKA